MLLSTITYLLLPAAVLAAPAPVTEMSPKGLALREAEGVGLATANVNCYIESSDGPVNCRTDPDFDGAIITKFNPGTDHTFTCYAYGPCIGNYCTWDYAVNWGCYVHGYYTDNSCSSNILPEC